MGSRGASLCWVRVEVGIWHLVESGGVVGFGGSGGLPEVRLALLEGLGSTGLGVFSSLLGVTCLPNLLRTSRPPINGGDARQVAVNSSMLVLICMAFDIPQGTRCGFRRSKCPAQPPRVLWFS